MKLIFSQLFSRNSQLIGCQGEQFFGSTTKRAEGGCIGHGGLNAYRKRHLEALQKYYNIGRVLFCFHCCAVRCVLPRLCFPRMGPLNFNYLDPSLLVFVPSTKLS